MLPEIGCIERIGRRSQIGPKGCPEKCLDYPGPCAVFLHVLASPKRETIIELPDQVRVASTPELEASVERHFGTRIAFHSLES